MTKRWLWIVFAAVLLPSLSGAWLKTEFFRLEDLKPGMKGVGKTCYQGIKPEDFQVEILGVLHGVNPGVNAVLARLSSSTLDKTGIFEGMSGSPVFIDGKLLGAVAFSYSFSKEAICGITPITQMVEGFSEIEDAFSTTGVAFNRRKLWNDKAQIQETGNRRGNSFVERDLRSRTATAFPGGHSLVPIATPLSLGGFNPETLRTFAPQFRSMGLSLLQGTGGAAPASTVTAGSELESAPLEPGSNIVVPLIRGDLDVSAGGTVTYIDGNKVYAFGHELLGLGFTELPIHNGQVIMIFPSIESSFKILETGRPVGSIRQDRGMGIYGVIGEKARMVPLELHLTTSRGVKRNLKYELARDSYLTPLLVNLAVYNSIVSSERSLGYVTLKVKGKISIRGEQSIELDNRFSSDGGAPELASRSIAAPISFIMSAGYKNMDLEQVDLDISTWEDDQNAILDSIRSDRTELRAGDSITLDISYKKANGEIIQESYPVKIPANALPGPLVLLVADGTSLMSFDEQEEGEILIPRDLTQLIKLINNIRKNDRLYLRFYREEPGVAVKGEGLPGLPPSILSILKSERKSGAVNALHYSTLMEYELPAASSMVSGSKALKLSIKP
jgi:hypothetical protein